MSIGAGNIARARRIAWTAGLMSFVSVGVMASIIAIFPDLWVTIFTHDESVRAASRQYLSTAAPCYAFIGLATAMYFSSQGAAKVLGPVLAQSARLGFIAVGGFWLSTRDATAQNFFVLAASSMVVLGTLSCLSVIFTRWGPKREALVSARPALSAAGE
jgi:Na+-driven multidrug efflux pump